MGFHLKKADCLHVCWRHGPENGGPYLNGLNPPTALLILKKKNFVPLLPPRCQTHWRVCLDECEAAVAVTRVVSGSLAAIILLRVRCPPKILEGFEQLLLLSAGRHTGPDAAD